MNKRWTIGDARELASAAASAEQDFVDFGLSHGFNRAKLEYWKRRLGEEAESPLKESAMLEEPVFLPLRLRDEASSIADAVTPGEFSLRSPDGWLLSVKGAADPDALGAVLQAMGIA